jgi:3-oxoacyl-(acyl-carrier-protein) synthase
VSVPVESVPVAVTGIGCVSSLGGSAGAFADGLLEGRTGFRLLTELADLALNSPRAARVTGYDPAAHIPPLKLRRVDEVGRLTIGAAAEALTAAGYPKRSEGYDDIGVILGTFTAGVHASSEYLETYLRQGPAASPALLFSNTVGNAAASTCGLDFTLRGPNATLMEKEASGLAAVAFGAHLVRRRKSRVVLAGGADAIERHFYHVHDWFGVMASGDEDPRPFDAGRTRFLMGEGAFLFVLEDLESATTRGARVLATLLGVASTASSERVNAWPREPRALVRAMRQAIAHAGLAPDAIDVIYASANGTELLDRVESAAIREVFGDRPVPVTSIKGAVGEFGAAGAASLAAAILCGERGRVAPVTGLRARATDCPVDAHPSGLALPGPVALVNSFASGGTHVSVVVRLSRGSGGGDR